ncbi:MAG: GerMN domain-containing protein [Christensenellaceae bacterium]|nr:GerMN domain-containing protein [Christensenellaceae bacterium]
MNKKLVLLIIVCLVLSLFFSSCTNSAIDGQNKEYLPLPVAQTDIAAPRGDSKLKYFSSVSLYLPDRYTNTLRVLKMPLELSVVDNAYEVVINNLLKFEGDDNLVAPTFNNAIGLFGNNPIEVSGNVASVNLTANALRLNHDQFYLLSSSITETLCQFIGIDYVNILVADKAVALDMDTGIPMGCLKRESDYNSFANHIKLLESRNRANKEGKLIEIPVTLYFPSNSGKGIVPETRSISFPNVNVVDMTAKIIRELEKAKSGSQLPNFYDLLSTKPEVRDWKAGGIVVTLRFKSVFKDVLKGSNLDLNTAIAMIGNSLSTFIPNLAGIKVYIGDSMLTKLEIDSTEIEFDNGLINRPSLSGFIVKDIVLFYSDINCEKLVEVKREVKENLNIGPRIKLLQLFKGKTNTDFSIIEAQNIINFEINDAEILGLSLEGNTLAINFAQSVLNKLKTVDKNQEKLFVYSIVNSICIAKEIKKVMFFFDGKAVDYINGKMFWQSEFMPYLKIVH